MVNILFWRDDTPNMLSPSVHREPPSSLAWSRHVAVPGEALGSKAPDVHEEYENADQVETGVKLSSQEASQRESMGILRSEETHGNVWNCWGTSSLSRELVATRSRYLRLGLLQAHISLE